MEANQLMIGDWVQVDNPSFDINNRIGHIIGIEGHAHPSTFDICFKDDDGRCCHYIECRKYNVKPIQLTQEIIEKNGFSKKHPLQHYCELKTSQYSIVVRFTVSNRIDYVRYDENNPHFPAEAQSFRLNNIQYVHQLQQALHLCGIEKEIEL